MGEAGLWVAIVVMLCATAAIILNWMGGRQRLAEIKASSAPSLAAATNEIETLSDQNAGLRGQVGRLEERLATLERIVTDPAERTAREIERLR